MRAWSLLLHAEPRASHGFDRRSRPAHLHVGRALPPEEVEQELAWRSGDAAGRFPPPCLDGLSSSGPLELKTCTAQSPRQEPASAADVALQGLVHGRLVRPGTTAVRSADILVVDEELIQAGQPAHPADAERAGRRSRPERRDEPGEVPQRERSSASFRQAAPRTGQDQPGAGQGSRSRRTRCAARSRVVHGARRVGGPGPSSPSRPASCARSAASKKGPAMSPECSQADGSHRGPAQGVNR